MSARADYSLGISALVIFSADVPRLAAFYQAVLHARPDHEPSGDIRLFTEHEEVLIHSIPAKIARTIQLHTPPEPRESAAIKPVFEVGALDDTLDAVRTGGGVVTGRTFTIDGLTRQDVLDPDGNVIQLRGRAS
jgi:predicted enzyme related to lactoylglutathione lyase